MNSDIILEESSVLIQGNCIKITDESGKPFVFSQGGISYEDGNATISAKGGLSLQGKRVRISAKSGLSLEGKYIKITDKCGKSFYFSQGGISYEDEFGDKLKLCRGDAAISAKGGLSLQGGSVTISSRDFLSLQGNCIKITDESGKPFVFSQGGISYEDGSGDKLEMHNGNASISAKSISIIGDTTIKGKLYTEAGIDLLDIIDQMNKKIQELTKSVEELQNKLGGTP